MSKNSFQESGHKKITKKWALFQINSWSILLTESNRPILKLQIRMISRILWPIRKSFISRFCFFVINNVIGNKEIVKLYGS